MPPLCPGTPAPAFTLAGTGGRSYTMSQARGHVVVLVFYPGDGTPVCTRQLTSYNDEFDRLEGLGATVWALSPQDVASHERFSCEQGGFKFPLLADIDKSVGQAYGIIGPLGLYRRSVFVVDRDGVIAWSHSGITGVTYRSVGEIEAAVRAAS